MKVVSSFRVVTGISLTGIALIAGITVIGNAPRQGIWWEAQKMESKVDLELAKAAVDSRLERIHAETQKDVAETYSENQIANFDKLILVNYTLSSSLPKRDWKHIVNPSKKVMIYDKYRRCIGVAYQGELLFIRSHPEVCNQESRK